MVIDTAKQFRPLSIAVLTISDTRDLGGDLSGAILAERLTAAGHRLAAREICRDDVSAIVARLQKWIDDDDVDVVLTTGGTGLTGRDVTPEALGIVQTRAIPGFGELFRWLSYSSIGTSTIQSRACAVLAGSTYIFALPGSSGAVRDGWDGILAEQLDSRNRPCNFVDLIPRLAES